MMPKAAKIERAAYAGCATALAVLPQMGVVGIHTSVALAGGGCLWWLYQRVQAGDFSKVLRTAQRALPVLTGAGIYAAAALADGTAWWEYATPAAWAALMCSWLPVSRAAWALPEVRAVAALPAAVEPAPTPAASGFEVMWAERVAGPDGAIPGSTVARISQQPGKVMVLAEVPAGKQARINHGQLHSAFGVHAEEMRLVAEAKGREALISLYDRSPLLGLRPATRELVTPDRHGRWVVGTRHNGQDAKVYLRSGAGTFHGFLVGLTGAGKTGTIALITAAQANGGLVSWVTASNPDAQLSQIGEHVDRQGSGAAYTVRMLRALAALMTIRGEINVEVGSDFGPKSPYPGLVAIVDEFNSLTGHPEYGAEIAKLSGLTAREGRKFGIGIIFAGQSLDLEAIGGGRAFREQTMGGLGIALRIAAGISTRQATAGLSGDVEPMAIPDRIGGGVSLRERMDGAVSDEPGEPTWGMGHVLNGTTAEFMRTLYVDFDSLADIFPTGGVNTLTEREIEALGGLYGDWTGGDDEGGDTPQEAATKPQKATVRDQILAVLTREMTAREIRQAVDAAPGTIRNALSELFEANRIVRTDRGYAPLGG